MAVSTHTESIPELKHVDPPYGSACCTLLVHTHVGRQGMLRHAWSPFCGFLRGGGGGRATLAGEYSPAELE